MVTARFSRSASGNATGSETTSAPGAMVKARSPPKVSSTVEPSTMSGLAPIVAARAISTPRISVSSSLKRLERCRRSSVPPIETCRIWRKELPARPGSGGLLCGSAICRAVAQVVTQSGLWAQPHRVAAANIRDRSIFFILLEMPGQAGHDGG